MATETFSELLKKVRKWSGLTQQQLADRIDWSRNSVVRWENDRKPPDRDTVLLIGERLGLETRYTNELLESAGYAPIPLEGEIGEVAPPELRLPYTQAELRAYLAFLQQEYGTLRLPDGTPVDLERIYVSLKADAMNAAEWAAEERLLLREAEALAVGAGAGDVYARSAAVNRAILLRPEIKMLSAREWPMRFGERESQLLSLADVVQKHEQVVILGDPGSGKTTLVWWLTLQFARATGAGAARVTVRRDLVRPGEEGEDVVDLGPSRLPIVVRVGEYAKARFPRPGEDVGLSLRQFMVRGRQYSKEKLHNAGLAQEKVGAMAEEALARGRALVLLDGMDEVGDYEQRRQVMEAVEQFLAEEKAAGGRGAGSKVLLTSRIVGYQFRPLTHVPHYTVEAMDETAIRAFTRAWAAHAAAAGEADAEAERLQGAIFEAHPGVRAMAGNPLLLTILAQVYRQQPEKTLPARRVALFEEAETAFYRQREPEWAAAGVSQETLRKALGAAAMMLQGESASGLANEAEVEGALRAAMPESVQVKAVLQAARELSGFLIARGEDVYGFLHRALQEYFAACYLVETTADVGEALRPYVLDPTWREPLLLAVGKASATRKMRKRVFRAILDAEDPAGAILPQRELVAAAACGECADLPAGTARELVERLLRFYGDVHGAGDSAVLRERMERALGRLRAGPGGKEAEQALCAALRAPQTATRWAAAAALVRLDWYTAPIVAALVEAWRDFAAPAGALLAALQGAWQHDPALFAEVGGLRLRRALAAEPALWVRARESAKWRATLRALYLPAGADFEIEAIHRDSPLTERLLAMLREGHSEDALKRLAGELTPAAEAGQNALGRDAALLAAALGEDTWVAGYAARAAGKEGGENRARTRAVLSAIYFIFDLTLELAYDLELDLDIDYELNSNLDLVSERAFDLDRALNVDRDLDLALNFAHDLARDRSLDLALDRARALACRSRDSAVDLAFEHALDLDRNHDPRLALDRALDLDRDRVLYKTLDRALIPSLAPDRDLYKALDRALSPAHVLSNLSEIETVVGEAMESWHSERAIVASLEETREWIEALRGSVATSGDLRLLAGVAVKLAKATAGQEDEGGEKRAVDGATEGEQDVTPETLPALVRELDAAEDGRRDAARRAMMPGTGGKEPHTARALGRETVEALAALAIANEGSHQVGTQLAWALGYIRFNEPAWAAAWAADAAVGEKNAAALILSRLHRPDEAVLRAMLEMLPEVSTAARQALLESLSHITRVLAKALPVATWEAGAVLLMDMWEAEKNEKTEAALLNALGYWPGRRGEIAALLASTLEKECLTAKEVGAISRALALQVSSGAGNGEWAAAALERRLGEATVRPAWVRMEASQWRESAEKNNVVMVEQRAWLERERAVPAKRLADRVALQVGWTAEEQMEAVWDAGTDDDVWDEQYHALLAQTGRRLVQAHVEEAQVLLGRLLRRYAQALEEGTWEERRMLLATLAACLEAMPRTVAQAADERGLDLEGMLVAGAADYESHNVRRFALTGLSYLRRVSARIVPLLVAGLRDNVDVVRRDAVEACRRFEAIDEGLVDALAGYLTGESVRTAAGVAEMLGALGVHAAGEESGLRQHIIALLAAAAAEESAERQTDGGKKLKEVFFEALVQVAGLPA